MAEYNITKSAVPGRLSSPFSIQAPNSVKADKIGISEGNLITNFASDAVALKTIRDNLQHSLDEKITRVAETTIEITRFKNWGETQEALLMHVKPGLPEQVKAIVKAVIEFNKDRKPEVIYATIAVMNSGTMSYTCAWA